MRRTQERRTEERRGRSRAVAGPVARLFAPFLRLGDPRAMRAGLGLSVARGCTEVSAARRPPRTPPRRADGRTGLRAVAQCRPDVVVLDLGLPDLDGTVVITEQPT